MYKDDAELVEKTINKIDKERHYIQKIPIFRRFNFEINKHTDVLLTILYKIERVGPITRYIFIDRNHVSVSYIRYAVDEDLEYIENLALGKLIESEW